MADRRRKLYMAHTLTTYLSLCDLNTAAVTDFTLIADFLILTAVALPVLGRAKDLFAEQAVRSGFSVR